MVPKAFNIYETQHFNESYVSILRIGPNKFYVSRTLKPFCTALLPMETLIHLECDPILGHSKGKGLGLAILPTIKHEKRC
jgi:hypothetical protein